VTKSANAQVYSDRFGRKTYLARAICSCLACRAIVARCPESNPRLRRVPTLWDLSGLERRIVAEWLGVKVDQLRFGREWAQPHVCR
jgi:hypothetical protein